MDMTFDLDTLDRARGEGGLLGRHLSWPELVSRMVAARQASGSLRRALRSTAYADSGSFHEGAAEILAAQAGRRVSVNPNDLGICKSGEATSSPVAGHTNTGGRGKP